MFWYFPKKHDKTLLFVCSVVLPAAESGGGSQGRDEDEEQGHHQDARVDPQQR